MAFDLVPFSSRRPGWWRWPSLWDEDEEMTLAQATLGGLTISEDDKNVCVEAAVPGVDPQDIEVTFNKGVLWIKAETREEEKKKKYYRKATSVFSYRVAVPGDIDPNKEPQASCKNGVMTVTFAKSPAAQPKKIAVKTG